MSYSIDNQTYNDLNLIGRFKQNSIFGLYNKCVTRGASILLEGIFNNPFTDARSINSRTSLFKALMSYRDDFPITGAELVAVDEYLNSASYGNYLFAFFDIAKVKLSSLMLSNDNYRTVIQGVIDTNLFLKKVKPFIGKILELVSGTEFESKVRVGFELLNSPMLSKFIDKSIGASIGMFSLVQCNRLLRHTYSKELRQLFRLIEQIDCYLTVSKVGVNSGFTYAEASESEEMMIEIENVRHPRVPGAVGNNISMYHNSNLIFLTGANMAGKSTLMKSFGISIYLAHLGFPLPVDKMLFTPMEGMYTSINVPDDITQGYSHFYAEVMRVKSVAIEVAKKKRLLIIFDELFKGTNVKDAYDGTLGITRAFSKCDKSIFIISTHIMEAGEALQSECSNVQFKYLPTLLVDDKPKYSYKLTDGIADDRYGMKIINNERILEIIRGD